MFIDYSALYCKSLRQESCIRGPEMGYVASWLALQVTWLIAFPRLNPLQVQNHTIDPFGLQHFLISPSFPSCVRECNAFPILDVAFAVGQSGLRNTLALVGPGRDRGPQFGLGGYPRRAFLKD